jgi:hypothetical protein
LHLDLWWRGLNVARDAGTYLYNAESPWDNSLTTTMVHNTVTVNGRDQFTRAGRFLYLDWVNAYRQGLTAEDPAVLQQVRGRYRERGFRHTRTVSACDDDHWVVKDELLPLRMPWEKKPLTLCLHWLLPDWKWEMDASGPGVLLRLISPHGLVELAIRLSPPDLPVTLSLIRAGELLAGSGTIGPTRGWVSPNYGIKVPALSLAVETLSVNEVQFTTEVIFPK